MVGEAVQEPERLRAGQRKCGWLHSSLKAHCSDRAAAEEAQESTYAGQPRHGHSYGQGKTSCRGLLGRGQRFHLVALVKVQRNSCNKEIFLTKC